ncbi:hypothetical protein ACEQ8H_007656 [Pleosporales sp. CAS-2024a]
MPASHHALDCPARSRTIGPDPPLLRRGAAAATAAALAPCTVPVASTPAMAPPAVQTQSQARPPCPRIVPAIPHRLSLPLSLPRTALAAAPRPPTASTRSPEATPVVELPAPDGAASRPGTGADRPAPDHSPPRGPNGLAAGHARAENGHGPAANGSSVGRHPAAHAAQPGMPRPPPALTRPEHGAPFFPGHAHHLSDVAGPWPCTPYTRAQPDAVYETMPLHHAPPHNGEQARHSNHSGTGHDFKHTANGATAAASPAKTHFAHVKPGAGQDEKLPLSPYTTGPASHPAQFHEPPVELAAYLSTQFGNPEFADFMLQIRSPKSVLFSLPVHGIIVARSPVLADAIRRSMPASQRARDARRVLDVVTPDPFVTQEALEEALKVIYGAPLLRTHVFLFGLAPYQYDSRQPSEDARLRMRQLLSYIAAGRALQLPSMQARGVDIATSLLRWDTVEEVLHVILRSSATFWPKTDGIDTEDPCTAALLNSVINFIAYNFPVDFKLYTIAPELDDIPRLPSLVEAQSATHHPRLSKIRFGDAQPQDDVEMNHLSRVLSSIMLSLPLPLLDRLFNHHVTASQIGWTGSTKIMRDVVAEREKRRKKALRSEIRAAHDGTIPGSLLSNMFSEEHIEPVEESPLHPSGYRIIAQRLTAQA